jgi:hypothetical protein
MVLSTCPYSAFLEILDEYMFEQAFSGSSFIRVQLEINAIISFSYYALKVSVG